MYIEIPECKKCCCLPLRHGILVLAYIALMVSILWFVLEVILAHTDFIGITMTLHKGISFIVQSWFAVLLCVIDIAFNVLLVVGAHKKDTLLLKVYFYYSMVTLLASLILFFTVRADMYMGMWYIHVADATFAMCVFGIQLYIMLLLSSEIRKLEQKNGLRFVNHVSEVFLDFPLEGGNNPFQL